MQLLCYKVISNFNFKELKNINYHGMFITTLFTWGFCVFEMTGGTLLYPRSWKWAIVNNKPRTWWQTSFPLALEHINLMISLAVVESSKQTDSLFRSLCFLWFLKHFARIVGPTSSLQSLTKQEREIKRLWALKNQYKITKGDKNDAKKFTLDIMNKFFVEEFIPSVDCHLYWNIIFSEFLCKSVSNFGYFRKISMPKLKVYGLRITTRRHWWWWFW